jgi:hypothetical protein
MAAPISDLTLQDADKVFKGNYIYRTYLIIPLISGQAMIQSLNLEEMEEETIKKKKEEDEEITGRL